MRPVNPKHGFIPVRFVCLLALSLVQPSGADAEQLPIKTYTTVDGLSHNRVIRIRRDSRGFLWFCTADGLSRFDGDRFVTYNVETGPPDIAEGSGGVYWMASYGRGVLRFQPSNSQGASNPGVTVYHLGEEPGANLVNVIYRDRAGRIWAGADNGLYLLDEPRGRQAFSRVELGLPSHPGFQVEVGSLAEDREGSLWIGTADGPVRRLPDGKMVYYSPPAPERVRFVRALLPDRDGRLWIGHAAGLIVLNPEPAASFGPDHRFIRRLLARSSTTGPLQLPAAPGTAHWFTSADGMEPNQIRALLQGSDGRILAGAYRGGLTVFESGRFHQYTKAKGLSDDTIHSLAEDADGNLWMGTWNGGAMKLARNGLSRYGESDGLGRTLFASISETPAGAVYIVSRGWRIDVFDGNRFSGIQLDLPLPRTPSSMPGRYPAIQDHTGEWWVASGAGIYRFPRVGSLAQLARMPPKAVYTTRDGLGSHEAISLFEDSRGDIWIGTFGGHQLNGGLAKWERSTQAIRNYSEADGSPRSTWPQAFAEDRSGNVWAGLFEGGLLRYSGGRFVRLKAGHETPRWQIQSLYRDRAGRLWFGTTRDGAGRIDDPTADSPSLVTYTTASGLSSNDVNCFTEDLLGRIYFGTGRGVDRLDPDTGQVRHFGAAEGIDGDVIAAFRDRQGALWFGTEQGAARLAPEPERAAQPPPIWIGGLRVSGASRPISELGQAEVPEFRLGSSQNHIHVEFFSLSFATGDRMRYQYKLEGGGSDAWSTPAELRAVDFANLAPGAYRFAVRAVNMDGLASVDPATMDFTILPPLWRRWWFVSIGIIFLALSIYAAHRYRLARLLELERVRTRIATDLHDDIGSNLSQISVLSEVVRRRASQEPGVSEPLSVIADLSRNVVDSLNEIVWAINPRRDRLSDLTLRMRRFAGDIITSRDLDLRFNAPAPQQDLKLGADIRREVFLIFKEAVNNIFRHALCRQVEIDFVVRDGWMELRLTDDGRGFDTQRASEGNGLLSMRQRAGRLGGVLEVVSAAGQGTTVRLKAPVGRRMGYLFL